MISFCDECVLLFVLRRTTGIQQMKCYEKKNCFNNNNNRYSIHVQNHQLHHGNDSLFVIGGGQFQIRCEEFRNECFYRNDDKFFDYDKGNIFGFNFNHGGITRFAVKRIIVFQMI